MTTPDDRLQVDQINDRLRDAWESLNWYLKLYVLFLGWVLLLAAGWVVTL